MTSLEIESSSDDPSPNIAELVTSILRQEPTEYDTTGTQAPETLYEAAYPTLHGYDGLIALQKLLPAMPNEALYALRDAIDTQYETPSIDAPLVVDPQSLFSQWVKKVRGHFTATPVLELTPELQPAPYTVEIIQPIEGWTVQRHKNSPSGRYTTMVRQSTLRGSFTINDTVYEFDPQQIVVEVGRVEHTIGELAEDTPYYSVGHRYYTYIPKTDTLYASKRYGGDLADEPVEDAKRRHKAFKKMTHALASMDTSHNL